LAATLDARQLTENSLSNIRGSQAETNANRQLRESQTQAIHKALEPLKGLLANEIGLKEALEQADDESLGPKLKDIQGLIGQVFSNPELKSLFDYLQALSALDRTAKHITDAINEEDEGTFKIEILDKTAKHITDAINEEDEDTFKIEILD
jgi:hypothetical protein